MHTVAHSDYHALLITVVFKCTHAESDSRANFFQSLRKNLEEAATEGYSQLQTSCLLTSQLIKEQYSDLPFLHDYSVLQSVRRDKYSTRFLPKSWSHVIPLHYYANGNCLFRYAPDHCMEYSYKDTACTPSYGLYCNIGLGPYYAVEVR